MIEREKLCRAKLNFFRFLFFYFSFLFNFFFLAIKFGFGLNVKWGVVKYLSVDCWKVHLRVSEWGSVCVWCGEVLCSDMMCRDVGSFVRQFVAWCWRWLFTVFAAFDVVFIDFYFIFFKIFFFCFCWFNFTFYVWMCFAEK